MSGLLGKKIGMTRVFDEEGNVIPATVIEAGPCFVTQVKTQEKDGYNAVQLGFSEIKEKNTNKPSLGRFNKAKTAPLRKIKEFPPFTDRKLKLGDTVKVDIFKPGETVKVSGLSKGKGFTGVIKRHGFHGGQMTHGQSDRLRAPGSVGQSSDPSRVYKGVKMPGRMGNTRVSVKGLKVVQVDTEKNLLFVKGAVPGARNNYLEIYKA